MNKTLTGEGGINYADSSTGGRIGWVDIAKGIGIILVFFGHTSIPYFTSMDATNKICNYLVASFHMPLFFFLSGMCFSDKGGSFKSFFLKKVRTMLVPYAFFSLVWICYDCALSLFKHDFSFKYLIDEFVSYAAQRGLHAIWFITCLFLIEILFFLIRRQSVKLSKNFSKDLSPYILYVSIALIWVLGAVYLKKNGTWLPWKLDALPFTLPFFAFGYSFKNFKLKELKRHNEFLLFTVFAILNQLLNYINCRFFEPHCVRVSHNQYGNYILFYLSAVCGIAAVVCFCRFIKSFGLLEYIGRNSMMYFPLHQIFYGICIILMERFPISSKAVSTAVWLVIMLAALALFTAVNEVFLRTPFCVLLGKKYIKKK